MNKTIYIISLTVVFLFLNGANTFAQKKDKKYKKYNEEITITAPYQPSISDAKKIDIFPKINHQKRERNIQDYSITPQKLNANFALEPLPAVNIKDTRKKETLLSNYIKIGAGNYKTPLAELYSASKQNKNMILGLHIKHLSSSGKINHYANSSNSYNIASIFGKKIFKHTSLMGNVTYQRNMNHYYGFKPSEYPAINYNNDDIKRISSLIKSKVSYESDNADNSKLQYNVNADFYHWWDSYKSLENTFTVNTHVCKPVEWLKFIESEAFAIKGAFEFYNSGDSIEAENSMHLSITPQIKVANGSYEIAAGVSLSSIMADTNSTDLKIFPEVYAKIHIIPAYLSLFGGVTGYEERQTFKEIVEQNPFTVPDIQQAYSTTKFKAFGGFTGNIARWLDFTAQIDYSQIDKQHFFINDIRKPLYNQFIMIYDDVTLTHLQAEFNANPNERFALNINGHYNNYNLDNEQKAWHQPEMTFNLNATYFIKNPVNIKINTKISMLMNRYAKVYSSNLISSQAVKLDNITDISINAEYYYSQRLSAFININNILAKNYDIFYNYPSYGINILAGVSYSF